MSCPSHPASFSRCEGGGNLNLAEELLDDVLEGDEADNTVDARRREADDHVEVLKKRPWRGGLQYLMAAQHLGEQ